MSVLDKIVSAVTPMESAEDRAQARSRAESAAANAPWLAMVLDHHRQIEQGFAEARSANDAQGRLAALKQLALILNGHSLAEEVVLYPSLTDAGEKGGMTKAYTEQTATKVQMALLEKIDPLSQEWLDKLEHIRGAVAHHMYQEEGEWLLELHDKAPMGEQQRLAARFQEEFERYAGGNALTQAASRMGAAIKGGAQANEMGYRN